jgi:hypothetical protein
VPAALFLNRFSVKAVQQIIECREYKSTANQQRNTKIKNRLFVTGMLKKRKRFPTFKQYNIGIMSRGYGEQYHSNLEACKNAQRVCVAAV